eukprot:653537-Rhodomonas_salina.8
MARSLLEHAPYHAALLHLFARAPPERGLFWLFVCLFAAKSHQLRAHPLPLQARKVAAVLVGCSAVQHRELQYQ